MIALVRTQGFPNYLRFSFIFIYYIKIILFDNRLKETRGCRAKALFAIVDTKSTGAVIGPCTRSLHLRQILDLAIDYIDPVSCALSTTTSKDDCSVTMIELNVVI